MRFLLDWTGSIASTVISGFVVTASLSATLGGSGSFDFAVVTANFLSHSCKSCNIPRALLAAPESGKSKKALPR